MGTSVIAWSGAEPQTPAAATVCQHPSLAVGGKFTLSDRVCTLNITEVEQLPGGGGYIAGSFNGEATLVEAANPESTGTITASGSFRHAF